MPIPQILQDFDIANATVSVWLYKKSAGAVVGIPRFTGRWIDTDAELDQALRIALQNKRATILEVEDYSLLANVEDGQALRIDALETHAALITGQAAAEVPAKKASTLKEVQNTDFYAVKLVSGDQTIYAIRRTDQSWESKKTRGLINVLFEGDQLGLNTSPGFNISRDVDFFIVGDDIVITEKRNFETVLSYKEAHTADFQALQGEAAFAGIFTDLAPLVAFVGTNKLHLRRACAIRVKGYYADAGFMTRLRQNHVQCGLNLTFDAQGRLVPTPETCADIIRALLDHRLLSVFSEHFYDVPNATVVQ